LPNKALIAGFRHFPFWKVIAIAYLHGMVKDKWQKAAAEFLKSTEASTFSLVAAQGRLYKHIVKRELSCKTFQLVIFIILITDCTWPSVFRGKYWLLGTAGRTFCKSPEGITIWAFL